MIKKEMSKDPAPKAIDWSRKGRDAERLAANRLTLPQRDNTATICEHVKVAATPTHRKFRTPDLVERAHVRKRNRAALLRRDWNTCLKLQTQYPHHFQPLPDLVEAPAAPAAPSAPATIQLAPANRLVDEIAASYHAELARWEADHALRSQLIAQLDALRIGSTAWTQWVQDHAWCLRDAPPRPQEPAALVEAERAAAADKAARAAAQIMAAAERVAADNAARAAHLAAQEADLKAAADKAAAEAANRLAAIQSQPSAWSGR
jgi:hypothetical protein